MPKSATEVMQEAIYAATIDAIVALKNASRGLPNNLLRDLSAIHANTTFADLPREVQASIAASVRAAFTRLLKEGYSVSSGRAPLQRGAPPRREGGGPDHGGGRPDGRPPRHRKDGKPGRPSGDRPHRGPKRGGPGR